MKKLIYALLMVALAAGMVVSPAFAGTTTLFNDSFTSGFSNWSSTTMTGHGALTNPAQATCDDYLPTGLGPCMGAYTGLPNTSGTAFATYVYGIHFDENEYNATWKTYLQTFVDNGTTIGLFNLKDEYGNLIFVLQDSPDGTIGHSIRVGCKKNDGSWIYSAWNPISPGTNPFGPYEITVNWKADTEGLCGYSVVHLPTGQGMSPPFMPTFNNSNYTFFSASLGITTISNGMRFKAWNDDFRSYHNFNTGVPIFTDDFETPMPLLADGRWGSGTGNVYIPTEVCDSPITPLSHCMEAVTWDYASYSSFVTKEFGGQADDGGVRIEFRLTIDPDEQEVEVANIQGNAYPNLGYLAKLQTRLATIGGLYYPQIRLLCYADDGNWYSQSGGGWINFPHYPTWGTTNVAVVRIDYKQEPTGSCAMYIWDYNGPAEWQGVTYFEYDNDGRPNPKWASLGIGWHNSTPGKDYVVNYDNFSLERLLP